MANEEKLQDVQLNNTNIRTINFEPADMALEG